MTTAFHGASVGLLIDGFDLSGAFPDFNMESSQAMHDRTAFGNPAIVRVPGLKNGKATGQAFVDPTAITGSLAVLKGRYTGSSPSTPIPAVIARGLSGFALGGRVDLGYFHQSSLAFKFIITDLEKVTFNGEPSANAIDYGVSLHALAAETSFPFNGASVDNSAATANGGVFAVFVTAIAGAGPNVVYKVQHSTDNSTWVDLATASAITVVNSVARIEVAAGTTVRRYLRLVITNGGTTSSVTGVAVFARR
jgi:hypothetical protein